MSFPRAKIQRFNEIQNCSPSPADYNPKIKSHVTGAIISGTERFFEEKSPAVSDNTSIQSLNSTCFRTPTLPKKKKQTPLVTKVKPLDFICKTEINVEALQEKIVECNNKDVYINDLTEQIEDMKIQLSNLKLQKSDLEAEEKKIKEFTKQLQEQHRIELENITIKHNNEQVILKARISDINAKLELIARDYENLKSENLRNKYEELIDHLREDHNSKLENLQLQYENERTSLKIQIMEIKSEMMLAKNEWEKLRSENKKDIENLLENIDRLDKLYKMLLKMYNEEIATKEEIIQKEKELKLKLEDDLNKLNEAHNKEMEDLKAKYKTEIADIEYEMLKTITDMQNKLDQEKIGLEMLYKSNMINMENNHREIITNIQKHANLQIKQIEDDCRKANELTEMQLREKYEDIENTWQIKLETQAIHSEKILKESQEIHEFNLTQCKVEKENLEKEFSERFEEVEKIWKIKLENQVKEAEEILKECQAISEYNIIQCELEKNDMNRKVTEISIELKEVKILENKYLLQRNEFETTYKQLKIDYDKVISDLEYARNELIQAKERHENEVQQVLNEKHTYEVTINKTHKTIEALTKRLFDSDRDVEQLKIELEICEKSKLALEDKCNKLTDELENVTKLNEDLEFQNESSLKLSEEKIQKLESELLSKVDEYKMMAENSVANADLKLQRKTQDLEEVKEQLHQQQALNSKAQNLIAKVNLELEQYEKSKTELEQRISVLSSELEASANFRNNVEETNAKLQEELKELRERIEESHLKNEDVEVLMRQVNQLQEKSESYYQYCEYYKCKASEYEKEIEDMNKINKNYIDQSRKYDDLLQKYETLAARNKELEKTVAEQESLIGPFREQLQEYEMERAALINQKCDAENEAKIMGMKYAQILGHQNHKQKIKHLIDLKRRNRELAESKAEIEHKVRSQARTIDKLKKEIALLTKSPRKQITNDKENINSPNRSINSSYVSSPLRDRN